jgi:CheY-like chemotaxis protein
MLSKSFTRIAALLLITCLAADPGLAFTFSPILRQSQATGCSGYAQTLNEQAVVGNLLSNSRVGQFEDALGRAKLTWVSLVRKGLATIHFGSEMGSVSKELKLRQRGKGDLVPKKNLWLVTSSTAGSALHAAERNKLRKKVARLLLKLFAYQSDVRAVPDSGFYDQVRDPKLAAAVVDGVFDLAVLTEQFNMTLEELYDAAEKILKVAAAWQEYRSAEQRTRQRLSPPREKDFITLPELRTQTMLMRVTQFMEWPEKHRKILVLALSGQLTIPEIARSLNLSKTKAQRNIQETLCVLRSQDSEARFAEVRASNVAQEMRLRGSSSEKAESSGAKLRVLLVDDDEDVRKTLQETLELDGFAVVDVESGRDALIQLRQNRFDAVVTDGRMPEMTGEQLIKEIRTIVSPHLPIVFRSADVSMSERIHAQYPEVYIALKGYCLIDEMVKNLNELIAARATPNDSSSLPPVVNGMGGGAVEWFSVERPIFMLMTVGLAIAVVFSASWGVIAFWGFTVAVSTVWHWLIPLWNHLKRKTSALSTLRRYAAAA